VDTGEKKATVKAGRGGPGFGEGGREEQLSAKLFRRRIQGKGRGRGKRKGVAPGGGVGGRGKKASALHRPDATGGESPGSRDTNRGKEKIGRTSRNISLPFAGGGFGERWSRSAVLHRSLGTGEEKREKRGVKKHLTILC